MKISSFVLIPFSRLLHWDKVSSSSVLLKVPTPLLLVHSISYSNIQEMILNECILYCKEFRTELFLL